MKAVMCSRGIMINFNTIFKSSLIAWISFTFYLSLVVTSYVSNIARAIKEVQSI